MVTPVHTSGVDQDEGELERDRMGLQCLGDGMDHPA